MCIARFTGRFGVWVRCFYVFSKRVLDGFGLSEWVWLVVTGEKCRCSEQVFVGMVMNFSQFVDFWGFLHWVLVDWDCYYRLLVSGFTGWLKLIAIKTPCKTVVLWNCWNKLCGRCWRYAGKCVRFGFFAADTATKQPKWLFCKCYSTAL